jgi:hypothetical protein
MISAVLAVAFALALLVWSVDRFAEGSTAAAVHFGLLPLLIGSEHDYFNHPAPRVQRRMEVLWLKSQGLSHNPITKLAGVCANAATKYLRIYRDGGLDGIT